MQVLLAIFIQRVAETVDTQERIKTAVANVLEQDQRLVFAYIYGSFARAEAFRDIDVGVYLKENPDEKILPGAGKQRRFRGFHHCDPGLRIAKVNLQRTW